MNCQIGNLRLTFQGNEDMAKLICGEFETSKGESKTHLKVNLSGTNDLNSVSWDMRKDERGRFYDTGYSVTLPKNKDILNIHFHKEVIKAGLIEKIAKIRDWNYLSPNEIVAKNIIYDVLEPVTHSLLIHEGMGFIHASSMGKDERCFLFTGEGGTGKTSLCIEGTRRGYGYMNDDLSLVDLNGFCFHYPKKLQIYGYNIKYHPELKKKVFENRSYMDRLMWNLRYLVKGDKKVRRRVVPKELFGDEIQQRARISKIFFLRRGGDVEVKNLNKVDFVKDELNIITKEFSDYIKSLKQMNENRSKNFFKATEKLYGALFDKADCMLVSVPKAIQPRKLFDLLEKEHFN